MSALAVFDHLLLPSRDALDFMADIAAREGPSALKARTRPPVRTAETFPYGDGTGRGDLYMPERPRAALLLVPGVARGGKDDPRLVAFATTVARLGFTVFVPELATLRDLNVRPEHREIVIAAFAHMVANPAWAPEGRAGIGGLSFAMGPGVIAALQPAIRDRVRFLFCIGGYFEMREQLRYVMTGWYRERLPGGPGPLMHMTPDYYGRWVLAASLADDVPDPASRAAIRAMVDRRVPDPGAPIDDLLPLVTDPAGVALMDFIRNTELERHDELLAALPPQMHQDLASMDIRNQDLSQLKAELILVHGYDDDLVPYTESQALHYSVPPGQSRLYLVRGLTHVTMGRKRLIDAWRLLSAVTALLAWRTP